MSRTSGGTSSGGGTSVATPLLIAPAGALSESFSRTVSTGSSLVPSTGLLYMTAVPLLAGTTVSNFNYVSAGTAASGPTNQWAALFDNNRVMLARSADGTTSAWPANTLKTFAVAQTAAGAATSFKTTYTGLYYMGIMQAASTQVATLQSSPAPSSQLIGLAPILYGSANSAMTTPPNFPFTANSFAANTSYLIYTYLT